MEIRKPNGDTWVLSREESKLFLKLDAKPKVAAKKTQNLEVPKKVRLPNKNKAWNPAEDKLVTSTLSARRIAGQLGRSKVSIYARRSKLKQIVKNQG
jgi:hypothetical protein